VAIARRVSPILFIGAESTRRTLTTFGSQLGVTEDTRFSEELSRAYLNWIPTKSITMSVAFEYEFLNCSDNLFNPNLLTAATTYRVPVEFKIHQANSLQWTIRSKYIDQSGYFVDFAQGDVVAGSSRFWVTDIEAAYRFPNRRGSLSLVVYNVFDEQFRYQEINPQISTIARERSIFGRIQLQF
jgi:outer membrane receptor protein involved in Fe transport